MVGVSVQLQAGCSGAEQCILPDDSSKGSCLQDSPNTLKVRDCNVTGNSVQSNGGGFYGDNMNLADFTDVQFAENIAGTGALQHKLML